MTSPSILVIEDEQYLRSLYVEILCDYMIESAKDGFEALNKDKKYDLYIVDIGLPGINGLETIEKLKEIHGNIKTIVATGYDVVQYSKELSSVNVTGVLQKPFKVSDLMKLVKKVLAEGV